MLWVDGDYQYYRAKAKKSSEIVKDFRGIIVLY